MEKLEACVKLTVVEVDMVQKQPTKKEKLKIIEKAMSYINKVEGTPFACVALYFACKASNTELKTTFERLFNPNNDDNTWNFDKGSTTIHNPHKARKNKEVRLTALALFHAMARLGDI